jgi:hypothetical protein
VVADAADAADAATGDRARRKTLSRPGTAAHTSAR